MQRQQQQGLPVASLLPARRRRRRRRQQHKRRPRSSRSCGCSACSSSGTAAQVWTKRTVSQHLARGMLQLLQRRLHKQVKPQQPQPAQCQLQEQHSTKPRSKCCKLQSLLTTRPHILTSPSLQPRPCRTRLQPSSRRASRARRLLNSRRAAQQRHLQSLLQLQLPPLRHQPLLSRTQPKQQHLHLHLHLQHCSHPQQQPKHQHRELTHQPPVLCSLQHSNQHQQLQHRFKQRHQQLPHQSPALHRVWPRGQRYQQQQ